MIVITQHCIHTVASSQPAKQLGTRRGILSIVRDVIPSKRDDVGFQTVGGLNCASNLVAAGKSAVMHVRDMDDAETLEGLWEPLQIDRSVLNSQHERLS